MTTDNESLQQTKIDIANIKKDISHISNIVEKLGTSFDSLIDLNRNVAVQDAKFKTLEQRFANYEQSTKMQIESELRFREKIEKKVEEMEESSRSERRELHKELLVKLDEFSASIKTDFGKTNAVVDKHERWIWYFMGIGAVLIFILNFLPLWEIITVVRQATP